MSKSKVVIRKYGDRRLYDTGSSSYVKLADIARMIRAGTEVEVLEARSGQDITRAVLTQIVIEDARDEQGGLPVPFLRDLVMASDRATHDFLSRFLSQAMDVYRKSQGALHSGISEARQAVSSPLDFVRHLLSGEAPGGNGETSDMEQLRRRIEQLEARLAETAAAPPRAAARKRTPGRKRRSQS